MNFDFDTVIDRYETDSIKYDFACERGKPEGILPLWVADMDFKTPQCVTDALVEKSRHGIFGYSDTKVDYFASVEGWMGKHFNWRVQEEWLVKTPGIVYAINTAIRSLTNAGDAVLIQQPVYYPFSESVRKNHRKLVVNELVNESGKYRIDFDDFRRKIMENNVKLFILCSPHNPVGRVWSKEELIRMGDICLENDVLIISDEIHQDFTFAHHTHHVFANLKEEFRDIAITCTAPTKTFNLAGLQISNIFIANEEIRNIFKKEICRSGYSQPNIMGTTACKAAYLGGEEWLGELKTYLAENLDFLKQFLERNIPEIKVVDPEGTYLVWMDFRALDYSHSELDHVIETKAKLWLNSGRIFGQGGEGFQRINIACPRSVLETALTQLKNAIHC